MIKVKRKPCIVAVFDDDAVLLKALEKTNAGGFRVLDCFVPFPIHGIEKLLGIKRSNLGVAAFTFGCIGFSIAMMLMTYAMRVDWPVDIGGKPTWPLASFVPILFELTVLIASLGMTFTFFWISGLFPGVEPVIYDKRSTDDRFVVLFDPADNKGDEIRKVLQENGVAELRDDEYVTHTFPGPSPLRLRRNVQ